MHGAQFNSESEDASACKPLPALRALDKLDPNHTDSIRKLDCGEDEHALENRGLPLKLSMWSTPTWQCFVYLVFDGCACHLGALVSRNPFANRCRCLNLVPRGRRVAFDVRNPNSPKSWLHCAALSYEVARG